MYSGIADFNNTRDSIKRRSKLRAAQCDRMRRQVQVAATKRGVLFAFLVFICHVRESKEAVGTGKGLFSCACTTSECLNKGVTICKTKSYCYSQVYLNQELKKVTHGCVPPNSRSLLCMNHPPALKGKQWPFLSCCNYEMCNEGVVPTAPPYVTQSAHSESVTGSRKEKSAQQRALASLNVTSVEELKAMLQELSKRSEITKGENTVFMAVIGGGVAFMAILSAFGTCLVLKYRLDEQRWRRNYLI